jgi:hypothetical protein
MSDQAARKRPYCATYQSALSAMSGLMANDGAGAGPYSASEQRPLFGSCTTDQDARQEQGGKR